MNRRFCGSLPTVLALVMGVQATAQPIEYLRDPTQPVAYRAEDPRTPASNSLQLNAIFIYEHGARALVNGIRVKPGDWVGGVRIERIEPGRVYFQGEQSGVLRLHPPILTLSEGKP